MPIRFATDTFGQAVDFIDDQPTPASPSFVKQAFLKSLVPIDCSDKQHVDQFVITGTQPTNSLRKVIFSVDDSLVYFVNGALVSYPHAGAFDDVIKFGNDVATLANLSNITAFVGKMIYPIIALQAPSDADNFPTIKIALATRTDSESLGWRTDSPVYQLAEEPVTIVDVQEKVNVVGSGNAYSTIRLLNDGSWSAFMTLPEAAGLPATAVQFRLRYSVANIGTDSAQIQSLIVKHTAGQAVVTGDIANIFSTVADYEVDLRTAYAVIRHAPLFDAQIKAYVNFLPAPTRKELIQIGTGTGARQEIQLPDSGIVPSSIRIFVEGVPFYDFDFSSELSTIILTAPANNVIAASYLCDYGQEIWREMSAEALQPYNDDDGTYSTRFSYKLPDDVADMKISNVYFRLERLSGSATESLGGATGRTQMFTLKHNAVPDSITFDQHVIFSYDEESKILSVVAARRTPLNISYDWKGDAPIVYSFAAGWSVL